VKTDGRICTREKRISEDLRAGVQKTAENALYRVALFSKLYLRFLCFMSHSAFSALILLVGRQEGHPACKKLSGGVLAWLSVWSEVQTCIWPS